MSRIQTMQSGATTSQYWRHKITGAVYIVIVRLAGRRVASFFGPLPAVTPEMASLSPERYDSDPAHCRWLEQRGREFLQIGTPRPSAPGAETAGHPLRRSHRCPKFRGTCRRARF